MGMLDDVIEGIDGQMDEEEPREREGAEDRKESGKKIIQYGEDFEREYGKKKY